MEQKIYDTSECFVTVDRTGTVDEDDVMRNSLRPEKAPHRSPETKRVSWDIGTTGEARPVAQLHSGYHEVTSSMANETLVRPRIGLQQTPLIAMKVNTGGKVDIREEASSDASQKTDNKSSSQNTVDLHQAMRTISNIAAGDSMATIVQLTC